MAEPALAEDPAGPVGKGRRSPFLVLILQRPGLSALVLVAASMVIHLGVEAPPGDFPSTYLGQSATPQAVANIRAELGLGRSVLVRYVDWLGGVLTGDFGTSWAGGAPVGQQIATRLANSQFLARTAALVSVPLAIGRMVAVLYRDGIVDRAINVVSPAAISLPKFFIGSLLILVFAVNLGVARFPAVIYAGMSLGERLSIIALPTATLVLVGIAHMMRMTRTALLSIMSSAYMETAELKGLGRFRAIFHHAAPNAVAPIVNVVTLNLAYFVVGVVVVEVVFVYTGMGQCMVDAVQVRDRPVVQACGIIFAGVYILLNMVADIIAIVANPRLRHPR